MNRGIYIASKAKHGPRWQELRAAGAPIISTWIDEAGEGETTDWSGLWDRIHSEIKEALALVFYGEEGEIQKGALVEIGIALGYGVPVFWVGPEAATVRRSEYVTVCSTLDEAIGYAKRGWAGRFAAARARPATEMAGANGQN